MANEPEGRALPTGSAPGTLEHEAARRLDKARREHTRTTNRTRISAF